MAGFVHPNVLSTYSLVLAIIVIVSFTLAHNHVTDVSCLFPVCVSENRTVPTLTATLTERARISFFIVAISPCCPK